VSETPRRFRRPIGAVGTTTNSPTAEAGRQTDENVNGLTQQLGESLDEPVASGS